MLKFEFRNLDSDTVAQLIELSKLWVEEDCSYGMVANEASDLQENLAVALDENRIVGYIFGHYYQQERKTSYIEAATGKRSPSVPTAMNLPQSCATPLVRQWSR